MARSRRFWLTAAASLVLLALLAGLGFYFYVIRRHQVDSFPQAQPVAQPGLAWLPSEAGLVGSVDLVGVRRQEWLLELLRRATAEATEAADYQKFVEATGFDYTRDLHRVWFALWGPSRRPAVAGVAEGRFAQDRIVAHARRQGARVERHQASEILVVTTEPHAPEGPPGQFAFSFLDASRLAFGSSAEQVARVLDCRRGKARCLDGDEARRQEIEQVAAGRQAWGVNELAKWEPPFLQSAPNEGESERALTHLALGVTVSEQGAELSAVGRFRDEVQAKRFSDNLGFMLLAARLALGREKSDAAQVLAKAMEDVQVAQSGDALEARLLLPPQALALLVEAAPPIKAKKF